jgi:iron-sulfur cluster repair protein YtfE (RIC family)
MSTLTGIDPAASLGELVAERPGRAPLFEELRLDYCCGGHPSGRRQRLGTTTLH